MTNIKRTWHAPLNIVMILRFNKMLATSWPVEEMFLAKQTLWKRRVVPDYIVKTWGRKGKTPLVLNLDTNLMWVMSLTLRPLQLVSRWLDGSVADLDTLTERQREPRISEFQSVSLYLRVHLRWVSSSIQLPTEDCLRTVRAGFAFWFHRLNLPSERLAPRCSVRSVERWSHGIVVRCTEGLYFL